MQMEEYGVCNYHLEERRISAEKETCSYKNSVKRI